MKKTYYVMDYQNGNKRIDREEVIRAEERNFILTEQYTPEQIKEIKEELGADGFNEWLERKVNENLAQYIVGIVEAEQKPTFNELRYDSETGEYQLKDDIEGDSEAIAEIYQAICDVAKSNTDFDIGFDYLFGFMAENPSSDTTKGFIEYHLEEMHAPTTADGKPEFTYLIGRDFVAEHWISEEDMATFNEYLKKREA